MATVKVVFDAKAMGDVFLRSAGTKLLLNQQGRELASRAGHGCRSHDFVGHNARPMAAVWTRAKTQKQADTAKRALEGAL